MRPVDDRTADLLRRLRADLAAARFTVTVLDGLWGPDAAAALHRGERVPARRALEAKATRQAASDPLAALAALFVLGLAVRRTAVEDALATLGVDGAVELGLVAVEAGASDGADGASVRALLDLRPYAFADARGEGHWWIISDLGELALGHALGEQHVLGVGGASMTLSGLMLPTPARRVLDLGTGCGIQAMHAPRFADEVIATDISARALGTAALNLALNEVEGVELRLGSLFDPVGGERFARIVSTPPFVITPRRSGVPEYDYRDGGMVGDGVVEAVMRGAALHLEPGGVAQLLGNWETRAGEDGLDRVREWAEPLEHWIVEREVQPVTEYAETWIRDGGTRSGTPEFDRLYDVWLDDFERRGVRSVGFGYVLLRRPVAPLTPRLARVERLPGPLGAADGAAVGLGSHLAACLAAHDRQASLSDDRLAAVALTVAKDVTVEHHYWPGDEDPTAMLLRQGGGFGRLVPIDTGLAGFVGACDGELAAGAIIAAIAQLLEVDESALAAEILHSARALIDHGMLLLPLE
ncbi:methyltransferase [Agromyces sp. Marseille-P2726]|uniref:DUF7059 domain-containing protein n=1 Tax=Agromyces sp. Marseille-P2726 TaxID=2709132 RepID=UPI001570C83A|nr:methyltransferase [Agromyces sp. Marseille-P2726]